LAEGIKESQNIGPHLHKFPPLTRAFRGLAEVFGTASAPGRCMMARRMERSGALIFFYGSSEPLAMAMRESKVHYRIGIWLALLVLVVGMLFFAPHALG
jgi:hypothetical protein